jgi:hypothetical protein
MLLIAADRKGKQPGKGEREQDGAEPSHVMDIEKEAKDPVEGMSENFHIIG